MQDTENVNLTSGGWERQPGDESEGIKYRFSLVKKGVLEILVIGAVYFVFSSLTHIYIPCPFRLITGKLCPGCGITHYVLDMIRLNFRGAFEANQFVFCLMPPALIYAGYRTYIYIMKGKTEYSVIEAIALTLVFIGAVGFGIYRNIG